MRDQPTRYPFPELRPVYELPSAIPWDTPIAELSGLWLVVECLDHGSMLYPLRRMAADVGHKRTLRSIVPKLKCGKCRMPPSYLALTHRAQADGNSTGPKQELVIFDRRGN